MLNDPMPAVRYLLDQNKYTVTMQNGLNKFKKNKK